MRKSRFSDEQIVKILRESDRDPVAEVAKRYAVSEQAIYTWRKKFGEMATRRRKAATGHPRRPLMRIGRIGPVSQQAHIRKV